MSDSKKSVQKPFALPKPGVKQAVIVDMIDLGQNLEQFGKEDPKVVEKLAYVTQIKEINPDTGKRFEPSIEYTVSLGKKGNLPKFFAIVRGSEITRDEKEKGVEWSDIVGKSCLITITHKESKTSGNKYAVISNVSALPDDAVPFAAEGYKRSDHWKGKKDAYAKAVKESEFKQMVEEEAEEDDDDLPF